jgi:signal transduction histidine kinase
MHMTGTNWDITASKQAEQAKTEFVSTVSHELRTPLTSIKGALGLINSGVLGEVPAYLKPMLDIANKNSVRLSSLINDLLDMEKVLAGGVHFEFQDQPLLPLVEQTIETIRPYGEPLKVGFALTVMDASLKVRVDGPRLHQVLANLLSNAAKFSPADSQVEIRVIRHGEMGRVEVQDCGSGIAPEFRGRIFQKFSQADSSDTRQKGGAGLGLAISKEMIERMNGRIGFVSEAGKGSCFYFELPLLTE